LHGLTSERLTEPAIDLDALPPVDLVGLSHMHEDQGPPLSRARGVLSPTPNSGDEPISSASAYTMRP
jgi:hypothetical protein